MKNYAHIIQGCAVDVTDDPKRDFHPEIAKRFIEVPATVKRGDRVDSKGNWSTLPVEEVEPVVEYKAMAVADFKLLFTFPELAAIKKARSANDELDLFWSIIDDQRTTTVDMNSVSVKYGVDITLQAVEGALDIDADQRRSEIFAAAIK